jgi:hypothetical protein
MTKTRKTRKELAKGIIDKYGYTVRKYNNVGVDTIIKVNDDYAKMLLTKELRKASKRQLLQVLNASDCKLEIAYFSWNGNKPRLLITFKPKKTINVLNFNYYFCV